MHWENKQAARRNAHAIHWGKKRDQNLSLSLAQQWRDWLTGARLSGPINPGGHARASFYSNFKFETNANKRKRVQQQQTTFDIDQISAVHRSTPFARMHAQTPQSVEAFIFIFQYLRSSRY